MYALFLRDDVITGYKAVTEEELETFEGLTYVILESLPPELSQYDETKILKWNGEGIEIIDAPPPPLTDADKIARLEQENITLMLALTQIYEEKEADKAAAEAESINNMLAITELYEMILSMQGDV